MRFLFACAGTAGHINPALAIAGKLRELYPDGEFLFVGAGREMEKRLIPAEGYRLVNLTITGFARGLSGEKIAHNIKTVNNLVIASKEAKKIIDYFHPDAVIGTGGYVCYPIITAAAKRKIPTFLHESNAIPGLANKLLSGVVDVMMVSFPGTEDRYKNPDKVVVTGTPVRGDFIPMSKEQARKKLGIIDNKPLVVSFWGSLGADNMNRMMADFISLNSKSGEMHHIHATGRGRDGLERMKEMLGERGLYGLPQWEDIRPYIDNMGTVMTAADVVLCRAGASTIAELTGLGRACVLVPSPNVTNNHQEKNAREVEKAGGAVVLTENAISGEVLYNTVLGLIRDPGRIKRMERACKEMGQPEACEKIVKVILSHIN